MSDVPLSSIVGGLGWKADTLDSIFISTVGITNANLLSVTPPSGKAVRLTAAFLPATSGTLTNVSIIFGDRTVVNSKSIQPAYSTSSSFAYSVGGAANSSTRYIEGKVGETLSVYKGAIDQNTYLAIGYEIGGYEK